VRAHPTSPATATTRSRRLGRRMARHVRRPSWMRLARHEPTARHPPKRGVVRRSVTFASPSIADCGHVDRNPNHLASTRNRIGHFGRAISGRNGPKRRETAQNAPKPPESGPPPCPVWEMNSDPSDPTYVRSCAHPRRPPEQAIAAPVRTDADTAMQHRQANPIKDQTKGLPAAAAPVHSRLTSPPRDHRKGFSWVPSLRFARAPVRSVRTAAARRHCRPPIERQPLPPNEPRSARGLHPPGPCVSARLCVHRESVEPLLHDHRHRPAGGARAHAAACRLLRPVPADAHAATPRRRALISMPAPRRSSPCLGRDVHAMGTQGTFRRSRRTTGADSDR
jgi:hypothetical protein